VNVLAFDTSCEYLSVAVEVDGRRFCADRLLGLRHSEHLVPAIERLMDDAGLAAGDLDLVACAGGPGSFTGLRIGMATAKGIAAGAGIPVVSVPSPDVYAAPYAMMPGAVVPIIDAKKAQVYCAVYVKGQRSTDILDLPPEEVRLAIEAAAGKDTPVLLVGPHPLLVSELLPGASVAPYGAWASAIALLDLAKSRLETHGADQDLDGPVYVRKSEAELGV
jgi:tRNA threonylcarbamoyladenosine biosynthesis protein TsaB